MGYLATEGDRRVYFEHHAGSGRTVVLSHGWGMSGRAWDTVVPALLDNGNAVVTYDHRACGQSDKDFADVSIDALGSDVVALCDHLGLDRVVLNGWSLGGAVVVDAAGKLGGRVAGVVSTVGATPRYTQADGWPYGGTAEVVAATVGALRPDRATFLHGLYHGGVFAVDVPVQVKDWCVSIALQAAHTADASLGALATVDQRDILAGLAAPFLAVVGAKDGVVDPGIGRAAAELAPNGRLVEFAECGHAPFLEDGDRYRAELVAFVNSLG